MAEESPAGLDAGVGRSYLLDGRPSGMPWGVIALASSKWMMASAVLIVMTPKVPLR